jgi:hypothetical protein
MPTRPVTWELDVPPGAPMADRKAQSAAKEIPSIADLRGSLVGGRFELLKIGAFAAFLFGFVAIAVHGSHVTSADNQFAAATGAAINGLAGTISNESGALAATMHGKTAALASSAMQSATAAVDHVGVAFRTVENSSTSSVAQLPAPAAEHVARNHRHSNRATAHAVPTEATGRVEKVAFVAQRAHHRHQASQKLVIAETPASEIPVEWSGNILDLPDFLSAEGSRVVQSGVSLLHGSVQVGFSSMRNRGQSMMSSLGNKFDVTNPESFNVNSPSSIFASLFNRENAVAAGAALLLYMIFVVVLVQVKGSLRAVGSGA